MQRLPGSRKAGVVWHTQGSGKSISMVCYAGKLLQQPEMNNPTLVVVTDRTDLDGQLFQTFSNSQDQFISPGRNNQNVYRLDSSFKELIPLILNGDTPFIMFIDEAVELSDSGFQLIEDFVVSNMNIAGVTLSPGAFDTVYGMQKTRGLFVLQTNALPCVPLNLR